MLNKKKIFFLVISIVLIATAISIPCTIFIIKKIKKDKGDDQPKKYDYDYDRETDQKPDYIEIEYQKIYKKLIGEYFKKVKSDYNKEIFNSVEQEIKLIKEKIKKEENFDFEWNKTLTNENVTTEEELFEKKIFNQQNQTFYDIFYEENYKVLLEGGFLKNSKTYVKGYIETEKPIHVAHFSIKINDDNKFKSKISNEDAIKTFNVINKMVEMSKKNKTSLEDIKNELNLGTNSKIEQVDEIIDKKSALTSDYKFGIYMSESKITEIYDEIKNTTVKIDDNLIPYKNVFMLSNKRYKLDVNQEITFCKNNEDENCKDGFADYNFLPINIINSEIMNEKEKEDFLLRNVIFNKFFKRYGISKITNKIIDSDNFEIKVNKTAGSYSLIEDKSLNDEADDGEETINNVILFCDYQNLHFVYINKDDNNNSVEKYINFKNSEKEKYKRKGIIKDKIKNFNIDEKKYNIFKYLLEITNYNDKSETIKKIKNWFEKKIKSFNYFEEEKFKKGLESYYEKIKFSKENEDEKIFNLMLKLQNEQQNEQQNNDEN